MKGKKKLLLLEDELTKQTAVQESHGDEGGPNGTVSAGKLYFYFLKKPVHATEAASRAETAGGS